MVKVFTKRNKRHGERGQILIPALFVIPSLILVTILVIETANLSRAKIRQQFSLDAAATIEMDLYTDMLNQLAYLNGVFPDRIFRDAYGEHFEKYSSWGLFPMAVKPIEERSARWDIKYRKGRGDCTLEEVNDPEPPENCGILHTHLPEEGGGITGAVDARETANRYLQVYGKLGDVATYSKMIFDHATNDHALMRKSMYMNLRSEEEGSFSACGGGADNCAHDAAEGFGSMDINMHYISGIKGCPTNITIQGVSYVAETVESFPLQGKGLWQLATVPVRDLERMEEGYDIKHHWQPPPNYFKIDFAKGGSGGSVSKRDTGNIDEYNASSSGGVGAIKFEGSSTGAPFVHAHVSSQGGRVWPETTPTYFTKLSP